MHEHEGIDALTLGRYLSGELGAVDEAHVRRWVEADPRRREVIEQLRAAWDHPAPPEFDPDDALWRRMVAQMDAPTAHQPVFFHRLEGVDALRRTWPRGAGADGRNWPVPSGRAGRWVMAVAVVIGATGLAVGWHLTTPGRRLQAVRELTTRAGGRATVTLRDGTRLTLGPTTRLRIPADFGRRTRAVDLEGEAVFAVVHDGAHPFVVHTSRTTVEDIGTTFGVRAYTADPRDQVVVQEGAVAIGGVVVHPKDVATVDSGGHLVLRTGVNVASYLAWAQGHLVFDATPLSDVARELSRTFDLDVTVTDSTLANQRVSASFADEPVDVILYDVTDVVGAQYERTGRVVVIRRRPPGARHPGARPAIRTVLNRDPHE